LERMAYTDKATVCGKVVRELIHKGAKPDYKQNGATSLLLVVLNPYSRLEQVREAMTAILEVAPHVAAEKDVFQLTAMEWATDYSNVAQQHGLSVPNPACLLALMPLLVELVPDDIRSKAGACCLKASDAGQCPAEPPRAAPPTRFVEGDRVLCQMKVPGGITEWEEGTVVGRWYREQCWPRDHHGAPYEVRLDIGNRLFALVDHDTIIRREADGKPSTGERSSDKALKFTPNSRVGAGDASKAAAKASAGPRFQRRQRPDGEWEMLDTISGKARACPPPDSDSD